MTEPLTLFFDEVAAEPWERPARGFVHEERVSETDEWYTPPEVFARLGLSFDLDPASPVDGPVPWVPASNFLTARENALSRPWSGRVWLNPPYSLVGEFLDRLATHGDGVALVFARTDTRWFHRAVRTASGVAFTEGRLSFVRSNGDSNGRPGVGSLFLAWGDECAAALRDARLGWAAR